MKRNDVFFISSLALYSYLFFKQASGINFFLFSVFQIIFFYFSHKEAAKSNLWKLSAAGVFLSGLSVLMYGSTLGVVANIISILVLSFTSISPGTSVVMGLFHNIYSIGGSIVFVILDFLERKEDKTIPKGNSNKFKNAAIFLVASLVMMIFLALYRSSNAVFKNITDKIDLSFISSAWIGFTILGFFLLYGLYKYRGIKALEEYDVKAPNDLIVPKESFFDKLMTWQSEKKAGVVLFIMLNVLLFFVNTIDVVYLYGGAEMPEGMTHSSMVHQGVNALITSIILAVSIILFFYRGRLNFIRNNDLLRNLSFAWIIQNAFMIFSTAYRNHLYVEEYLLTYKRIGVYVYLGLCIIGLVYTFIKIKKVKTNWYIVRYVGWSFYSLLFISALVNWDGIIIKYNLSKAKGNVKNLDVNYLVDLPSNNIAKVYSGLSYLDPELVDDYRIEIYDRVGEFIYEKSQYDWRSFNLSDARAKKELDLVFPKALLDELTLTEKEKYHYGRGPQSFY